jgi:hypothetical protein
MTLVRAAALVHLTCSVGVAGFQLALAFGTPLGAYAMGGRYGGTLPPALRLAEVVQAVLVALLTLIVMAAAGVGLRSWRAAAERARWLPVIFACVALVLNLVTPSAGERMVWAPVAAVSLAASLCVALRTSIVS